MNLILKAIFHIILFIFLLIVFLPKEQLYYFVAKNLQSQKIELTHAQLDESIISLFIQNTKVKYNGIEALSIDKTSIKPNIFFNEIYLKDIKVDKAFKKFLPSNIDFISANINIFNPININIESKFALGKCIGNINLIDRVIRIDLFVSKQFKSKYRILTQKLKKVKSENKEEHYIYEYKF
jgi:hypothetical protein